MATATLLLALATGFNSLQAGNTIQSVPVVGVYKVTHHKFQFPSSGKYHPKFYRNAAPSVTQKFQFPSSGKYHPKKNANANDDDDDEFQFPSSGKYHPKFARLTCENKYAICFNSLQAGNTIQSCSAKNKMCTSFLSFNSLQAGNTIQSCS